MSDLSSSSRSSTPIGTGMPKPATQPISDCERRRISITRLERQNILIDGYRKFLIVERSNPSSTGIAEDIERNLQETIQARDKLVSELRTLPPCLDVNCPDHTTLKSKDNDNLNVSDNEIEMISSNINTKKSSLKRKNSKGSSDGFVFPSKSARPITPTPVLNPIATSNSFDNLEQDAEIAQAKSPEIPKMSDKSSSSRSSTPIRTGMPKPATQPISDCERRRISITRLERQNILIDGYKKFLIVERNNSSSTGIAEDIEMNLQETIQARDKLVSELRTLPPCLDVNCPDHTTLKSKDNDNLNDSDNEIEMISSNINTKKSSLKRKNSKGSSDGFVFPSKSARPITPTPVLNPIATSNSFDNLEQDAEIAQAKSPEIPQILPTLKKTKDVKEQALMLMEALLD
ncbi:uncharacterized protein TNIN_362331 [Trichonephila inaurata madagascariensis]|uniref:Uncharacterized protein n=1 Tax=Trichonephila inaurata madagascariensis TaxID=2747483 RepID=A0A8X6XJN5_9ARAC|nr:uncharacterized protein TNIN_362331 [Trichonephila inaurata madagascariensis]